MNTVIDPVGGVPKEAGRSSLTAACLAIAAAYAAFLIVELWLGGAWSLPGELAGSVLVLLACVAPVAGLAGLAAATGGMLRPIGFAVLLVATLGGGALDVYALHLAPPDGQNAIVVFVVAAGQTLLLAALGAAALVRRFLGARS